MSDTGCWVNMPGSSPSPQGTFLSSLPTEDPDPPALLRQMHSAIRLGWFETRPFCVQTRFHQQPWQAYVLPSLLLLGRTGDINARSTSHRADPGLCPAGPLEQLRGCRMDKGMRSGPAEGNTGTQAQGLQGAPPQRPPKAPHPSRRSWLSSCHGQAVAALSLAVQGPARNGVCHQQVKAGVALGPAPS